MLGRPGTLFPVNAALARGRSRTVRGRRRRWRFLDKSGSGCALLVCVEQPTPNDDTISRRLRAGQVEAFAAIYDRFGERLYRTALRLLARPEDAEDAVQEVFVSLVRSRERLKDIEDLTAYLFASLRRAAARIAVRRARLPAETKDLEQAVDARTEPFGASGVDEDKLERAIGALPRQQREVLALKVEGELTFSEIGRTLAVSVNTAASRYRYALEKLRDAMKDGDQ